MPANKRKQPALQEEEIIRFLDREYKVEEKRKKKAKNKAEGFKKQKE